MKHSYRITKYWQYDSEGFLTSPPQEWTSFHDIKKGKGTLDDYLKTENEYLDTIYNICNHLNINSLTIKDLSNFNQLKGYKKWQKLNIKDAQNLARLILREEIWCKLHCEKCEFHFGYDYYMYCVCNENLIDFFKSRKTFLNIEEFKSPYISLEN